MVLLAGFAFLAGIITILSPCVLPVLPVVLSGGLGAGKLRPWGVATGFVISFTVFTLVLSALVRSLGVDPDLLRGAAAGIILVFGVVLAVPALKDRFGAWVSGWRVRPLSRPMALGGPGNTQGGFWSGLVLGAGLGLVWTPCVGPILASVIALALSQAVDLGAVVITLAYALGTALPLVLILWGGRNLLTRFPWVQRHSAGIQRGLGILMVTTAVTLFTGADRSFSTWLLTTFPSYGSGLTALETQDAVKAELDKRRADLADQPVATPSSSTADPLALADGAWIGSDPLTLAGLKGKVVLVDFWTYSCINCLRTLPYLRAWYDKYKDDGLVIVGVHSPEFAFEHSQANVRKAVADLGVTWPVVQDNSFGIWNAFENQYWPAHYLFDRTGRLVDTHFGEGNYAETEAAIAQALGVASKPVVVAAFPGPTGSQTPETYLGSDRASRFDSPEPADGQIGTYSTPQTLPTDHWALSGRWAIGKEAAAGEQGASLVLRYRGARVYLVMGPGSEQAVRVRVTLDGTELPPVLVDGERMYPVAEVPTKTGGLIRLEFDGPVRVYALTFG